MRLSSANRCVDSESTILVAGDFSKGIAIRAGQAAVSAILRVADLYGPISARSMVVARRVTQDHARPFCTVKAGTARGFCEPDQPNLGSPAQTGLGALSGKTARTKRRNEGLSIGP